MFRRTVFQEVVHSMKAAGAAPEELVTALRRWFKGALFAHVLRSTGDRRRTEDAVQGTVAGRIVIDGWRTRRSRPREAELTSQKAAHAPDGTGRRPSVVVIADVIGRLGEEHRDAIYETYIRGRTIREAAQVLGIPEDTVKSRVYHAMKTLHRALGE